MGEFLDFFKNKKNLFSVLILGILVLAIPLGLQYRQLIFKSRATEPPIVFKDSQGNALPEKNGIPYISASNIGVGSPSAKVKIQLTSPLGPPATPGSPSPAPAGTTVYRQDAIQGGKLFYRLYFMDGINTDGTPKLRPIRQFDADSGTSLNSSIGGSGTITSFSENTYSSGTTTVYRQDVIRDGTLYYSLYYLDGINADGSPKLRPIRHLNDGGADLSSSVPGSGAVTSFSEVYYNANNITILRQDAVKNGLLFYRLYFMDGINTDGTPKLRPIRQFDADSGTSLNSDIPGSGRAGPITSFSETVYSTSNATIYRQDVIRDSKLFYRLYFMDGINTDGTPKLRPIRQFDADSGTDLSSAIGGSGAVTSFSEVTYNNSQQVSLIDNTVRQSKSPLISVLPQGLVKTAYADSQCPDDLRYCDSTTKKTIHKHGGVFKNGSCVYAFDIEGDCNLSAPAPGGGTPSGNWFGCSDWTTNCEDKSKTCTENGKTGTVCTHVCRACGTPGSAYEKNGACGAQCDPNGSGRLNGACSWTVCVTSNNLGTCKETADINAKCTTCVLSEKNKSGGGDLVAAIQGFDHSRFDACSFDTIVSYWCEHVSSDATSQCNSIKNGACASQCAGVPNIVFGSSPNPPGGGGTNPGGSNPSCQVNYTLDNQNPLPNTPLKVTISTVKNDNPSCVTLSQDDRYISGDKCSPVGKDVVCNIDSGSAGAHKLQFKSGQSSQYPNVNCGTQALSCNSINYTTQTVTPPAATTVAFRVAEDRTGFTETGPNGWQKYDAAGMTIDHEFTSIGQKFIWVEFRDSNGKKGGCGDNKDQPCNAQIKVLGGEPIISNCSLSFEGDNTVLNLTGIDFGPEKGSVKSGDSDLEIREWKGGTCSGPNCSAIVNNVKAVWKNAPTGQVLPISLTNSDGQTVPFECSAASLLTVGAKYYCGQAAPSTIDKVDMTLVGVDHGGTKVKQQVSIDKDGVIQGLTQKLQTGSNYKLSLKASRSLRRTSAIFKAEDGVTNISGSTGGFTLPIGDIAPAGGDSQINSLDFSEMVRQWNIAGDATGRSADLNGDGRVNSIDWSCMSHDFGTSDDPEPAAP